MVVLDGQRAPAVVAPRDDAPPFDGRTVVLVDGDPAADRDVVEAFAARTCAWHGAPPRRSARPRAPTP